MLTGGGVKIPLEGWMPRQNWEGEVVDSIRYYAGLVIVDLDAKYFYYGGILNTTGIANQTVTNNVHYIKEYKCITENIVSNGQILGYINNNVSTVGISSSNFFAYNKGFIRKYDIGTWQYIGADRIDNNIEINAGLVIKASTAYIDTPSGRIWFTDWAEANGIDLNFYET